MVISIDDKDLIRIQDYFESTIESKRVFSINLIDTVEVKVIGFYRYKHINCISLARLIIYKDNKIYYVDDSYILSCLEPDDYRVVKQLKKVERLLRIFSGNDQLLGLYLDFVALDVLHKDKEHIVFRATKKNIEDRIYDKHYIYIFNRFSNTTTVFEFSGKYVIQILKDKYYLMQDYYTKNLYLVRISDNVELKEVHLSNYDKETMGEFEMRLLGLIYEDNKFKIIHTVNSYTKYYIGYLDIKL